MEAKKSRKIVIVGGSAAGSTVGANLRRLDDFSEIVIIERDPDVSFSNCSLPYYFSDEVEEIDDLIVTTPEQFKKRYNIDARVNEEVIDINREEKFVVVVNLETKETYKESYDYLILAPGGEPKTPKNLLMDKVFTLRNVEDVRNISEFLRDNEIKNVGIIGNGFIGVEVGEAFKLAGKNVTLFGSREQVLTLFDEDMAQIIHKEMLDHDLKLVLGCRVSDTTDYGVEIESGKVFPADLIILAIGISPNTKLVEKAGLKIGETRGILVDSNYKTEDEFIYAIGDAVEVFNEILKHPTMLALAGPAHRQADIAANHIYGIPKRNKGVIGASILRVFDLNCASVGLNERDLIKEGINYSFVYSTFRDKVHDGKPIHLKLIFEVPTGQVLGGQVIGYGEITPRIHVISTIISLKGSVYDLWDNELAYSPIYSTTKDATNMAGALAVRILNGEYEKTSIAEVRPLVEEGKIFLDTRSKKAYEKGHIKNSINIPIGELRERLEELPKDEEIRLNSYTALRILQQRGFKKLFLVDGDFEDLCLYEYFRDETEDREKIVTEYKFV